MKVFEIITEAHARSLPRRATVALNGAALRREIGRCPRARGLAMQDLGVDGPEPVGR